MTRDQDDVRLELTDTIREQEKDLDFLNAIVSMMLKEGEMYRLKEKIEYDFESGKWKVPPFLVKSKEVAFPRIRNAMNLVRDEIDQREVVMADTGEVLSQGSYRSEKRRNGKGRNQDGFKSGNQKDSHRSRQRIGKHSTGLIDSSIDSAGNLKGSAPFRNGLRNQGSADEPGRRFNNDYYASGKQNDHSNASSNNSSVRGDQLTGENGGGKFSKNSQMGTYEKNASQMSMKRNDSDFNARTGPAKPSQKYSSIDRNSGMHDAENEISPLIMKKKANVHLQPMTHKKA